MLHFLKSSVLRADAPQGLCRFPTISLRKISMSYVINDDFDGGELEFFHGGEKIIINATKDSLIAFTSFINHRVHKVTRGVRKALVVWVNGESWR